MGSVSDTTSSVGQWPNGLFAHGPGPGPGHQSAVGRAAGGASDSTVVTTSCSQMSTGSGGSPTRQPGIEGRVGKAARRRSRASRRAPVTLLNTDTTNFRAMVQQFTGIPSAPYASGGMPAGGPIINFGVDYNIPMNRPGGAVLSFEHLQQSQLQQEQLLRSQHQQQQHQPYPYSENTFPLGGFTNSNTNTNTSSAGNHNTSSSSDIFAHGFSSDDRAFLESMQAAQLMARPASTNNTRVDGYFG